MILSILIPIIQTLWLIPIIIGWKYLNFIVVVPFSGILLTLPVLFWWHRDPVLKLMASVWGVWVCHGMTSVEEMWCGGFLTSLYRKCDVGIGGFLLFTLGSSWCYNYVLPNMIYLVLSHWFRVPYYSKIYYVQRVLTYIRYLFFPLFVTPKSFYSSAKIAFLWQPVTVRTQVVFNQRPLINLCLHC